MNHPINPRVIIGTDTEKINAANCSKSLRELDSHYRKIVNFHQMAKCIDDLGAMKKVAMPIVTDSDLTDKLDELAAIDSGIAMTTRAAGDDELCSVCFLPEGGNGGGLLQCDDCNKWRKLPCNPAALPNSPPRRPRSLYR